MPYTPDSTDLPSNVKKLPRKRVRQWVDVWNSAFAKCKKDGGDQKACETSAFKQANGVIKDQTKPSN